eukprot:GFUD01063999.1.p1 GENE.GFUD01063999.1~~GFUD01063999.1.p1  ORF type:complete len:148 (-),score=31.33 GFUD01063999.1:232-675(-)
MDTPTTTKDTAMEDVSLQPPPGPPPTCQTPSVRVELGKHGEVEGPRTQRCSTCNTTVWTTVTTSTNILGWVWFLLCYCFCCVCALLPFYLKPYKKFEHFCPNCGALLKTTMSRCTSTTIAITVILFFFCFIMFPFVIYIALKYIGLV